MNKALKDKPNALAGRVLAVALLAVTLVWAGQAQADSFTKAALTAHHVTTAQGQLTWNESVTNWTIVSNPNGRLFPNGPGDDASWLPASPAFDVGFRLMQDITVGTIDYYGSRIEFMNDGGNAIAPVRTLIFDNTPNAAPATYSAHSANSGTGTLFVEQFWTQVRLDSPTVFTFYNPQRTVIFSGQISGGGGLTFDSRPTSTPRVGILFSTTPHTYTGGTVLNAGKLYVNSASTLGDTSVAGNNITVNNNGTYITEILLGAATCFNSANQTLTLNSSSSAVLVGIGVGYNAVPTFVDNTAGNGGVFEVNTATFTAITDLGNMFGGGPGSTDPWYLGSGTSDTAGILNGTFTGTTLAPASDGNYRLGGGGGTLIFNQANVITGPTRNLIVGSTALNGNGTVRFDAAQDWGGTCTINTGSTLSHNLPANGTFSKTLAGGGNFTQAGGATAFRTLSLSSVGNTIGTVDVTGGTLSLDNTVVSSPDLTIMTTGDACLRIRGATARFVMSAGTLNMPGRFRLGNDNTIGIATFTGGTVNHTGNNIDAGFNQGRVRLTFKGNVVYAGSGRNLDMSNANYCNSLVEVGEDATVTLGNIIIDTTNSGAHQYGMLNLDGNATVTAGALTIGVNQNQNNGNVALATVDQTGGIMTINGVVKLAGDNQKAGSSTTALQGTYNLAGGTLIANQVVGGGAGIGGQARFNFRGGILAVHPSATGAQASDFIKLTQNSTDGAAYIYEGATIDTAGLDVTNNQALLRPTGDGLTSIPVTAGGSGYFIPPAVKITNTPPATAGSGATATAVVDPTTGAILSILITSPGNGYGTAPGIALDRGNGTGATIGTPAIGPNSTYTGGLTKIGLGTLTCSANNTYAGMTLVRDGALIVNGTLGGGADAKPGTKLGGTCSFAGSVLIEGDAELAPGSSAGTLAVGLDLTLDPRATATFELAPSALGVNDKVTVGRNLTLNGNALNIAALGNLDTGHDYVLMAVTGTIGGSCAADPVWVGAAPRFASYFKVVTEANQVVLRYTGPPQAPTTTGMILTSGSNPSVEGAPLGFTITVTGNAPSGNVIVTDGASTLATLPLAPSGLVVFTTTSLGLGPHSLLATYDGDLNNQGSISSAVAITVNAATYQWTGAGANLLWDNVANWNNMYPSAGKTAIFSDVTAAGVKVDLGADDRTIAGITFNNVIPGIEIAATTDPARQLILDNAGAMVALTTPAGTAPVISAPLLAPGGIAKTGPGKLTLAGNGSIGDSSKVNALMVDVYGAGSELAIAGNVTLANANDTHVCNNSTLTITGTYNTSGHDQLIGTGDHGGGTGHVILSGTGNWTHTGGGVFVVGNNGIANVGTLDINDAAVLDPGANSLSIGVGWGKSTGIVNQNGGRVHDNGPNGTGLGWGVDDSGNSSATYNLNGGVHETWQVYGDGKGTNVYNFNGGTLSALSASYANTFIVTLRHAYVRSGGAKIDTGGFDVGTSQSLEHDPALGAVADGGLTKKGLGTFTLLGSSTYTGPTVVEAGILAVGISTGISHASVEIKTGAKMDLADGVATIVSGLTFDGVPQATGSWGSSSVVPPPDHVDDVHFQGTGVLVIPITLQILWPGGFVFDITGNPVISLPTSSLGLQYRCLYTDNLTQPAAAIVWTPVQPCADPECWTDGGGLLSWTDVVDKNVVMSRFYLIEQRIKP